MKQRTAKRRKAGTGRDIVVMGASGGGIDAIQRVLGGLPDDLPAAIFVVIHIAASSPSLLSRIFGRAGPLPAVDPTDGHAIESGVVYVAQPDQHLVLEKGCIRLVHGPRENRHRPAIDPLFRSAALAYGPRVIGVLLTGNLDDGTAGLLSIKHCGGLAVVQDPADAQFPDMPRNALSQVRVDRVATLAGLPGLLPKLVQAPRVRGRKCPASLKLRIESALERVGHLPLEVLHQIGRPSVFTCPECRGTLWEIRDGGYVRYRCRVGHAYSPASLDEGQSEFLEPALWSATRALDEKSSLLLRLARRARENRNHTSAANYEQRLQETEAAASTLRRLLREGDLGSAN